MRHILGQLLTNCSQKPGLDPLRCALPELGSPQQHRTDDGIHEPRIEASFPVLPLRLGKGGQSLHQPAQSNSALICQ